MIPRTLSASAVITADACLARWNAEYNERGRGIERSYTKVGSACHEALEPYVKAVYLDKAHEGGLEFLLELFKISYMKVFQSSDFNTPDFRDGKKLLGEWFERTDFTQFTVIAVEERKQFQLKTSVGEIPFTYIIDRLDMLGPGVYRVTDYKTNQIALSPEGLKDKIQARTYALAVMMQYPDATEIWVEFDMFRHGGTVGVVYDVQDCRDTYRFLRSTAERIIAVQDPKKAPRTLNPECHFCVMKTTCDALGKNVSAGGVFAPTTRELIDRRAQLSYAKKGIEAALKEMDEVILGEAKAMDLLKFEGTENDVVLTSRSMRFVDADRVADIIGPERFRIFGTSKMTLENFDKLLDGPEITESERAQLANLVSTAKGNPFLSARKKPAVKKGKK